MYIHRVAHTHTEPRSTCIIYRFDDPLEDALTLGDGGGGCGVLNDLRLLAGLLGFAGVAMSRIKILLYASSNRLTRE